MFLESSGCSPQMAMIVRFWVVVLSSETISVARVCGTLNLVLTPVIGESGRRGNQPYQTSRSVLTKGAEHAFITSCLSSEGGESGCRDSGVSKEEV